ncbi:MAG: SDR family oxidoreductase [Chlorobiales bacterium]|jgi:uncharacterized protein|nr:SDR family oxidoreductase [Chlorobiales bacterium]
MAYTLITGASSGIGEGFAKEYARRGHNLILSARSEEKLTHLARQLAGERNVDVRIVVQDLSEPDGAEKIYDFCQKNRLDIELLINNAGVGIAGEFSSHPLGRIERMMTLNMLALVKLTHLVLPEMRKRNGGGIINVASTAAFQSVPYLGVYSATKAFVLSFSEALNEELKETGIKVMALCPGGTDTAFFDTAEYNRAKFMLPLDTTENVVRAAIDGFRQGRSVVICGVLNNVQTFLVRFFPRNLVTKIAGGFLKSDPSGDSSRLE